MSEEDQTPRRGKIGVEIFEQVEKLVEAEGLSRTQAFERLSQETGRRSGTVAANYYRIARQRGASLQSRGSRGPGRPRGRRSSGGDTTAILQRANEVMAELTAVVRRQEKELVRLREQASQLEKFRKWMDKNT